MEEVLKELEEQENKQRKKANLYLSIAIFLILLLPIFFTRPALHNWLDFSATGEIGSTIGGITAPVVGVITALLMYWAFVAQLKANRIQFTALLKSQKITVENSIKDFIWNTYEVIRQDIHSNYYQDLRLKTLYNNHHNFGDHHIIELTAFINESLRQISMLFKKVNGYKPQTIRKEDVVLFNSQLLVLFNRLTPDYSVLLGNEFEKHCKIRLSENVFNSFLNTRASIFELYSDIERSFNENYLSMIEDFNNKDS